MMVARRPFGGTTADVVLDAAGDVVAGASVTVWTAQTGGAKITDLQTATGGAVTAGVITADAYGVVQFLGPADGSSTVWVDGGAGVRFLMASTDLPDRVGTLETGSSASSLPAPFAPGNGNAWGFGADMYNGCTSTPSSNQNIPWDEALTFDAGSWSTDLVDNAYMHWNPATPEVFTVKQAGWYMAYFALQLGAALDFPLNVGIDFSPHGANPNQDSAWDFDIPTGGGKNTNKYLPLYLSAGAVLSMGIHLNPTSAFGDVSAKSVAVGYAALFLTPLFAMTGLPA